jgi:hypothetical protein
MLQLARNSRRSVTHMKFYLILKRNKSMINMVRLGYLEMAVVLVE